MNHLEKGCLSTIGSRSSSTNDSSLQWRAWQNRKISPERSLRTRIGRHPSIPESYLHTLVSAKILTCHSHFSADAADGRIQFHRRSIDREFSLCRATGYFTTGEYSNSNLVKSGVKWNIKGCFVNNIALAIRHDTGNRCSMKIYSDALSVAEIPTRHSHLSTTTTCFRVQLNKRFHDRENLRCTPAGQWFYCVHNRLAITSVRRN